MFQPKVLSPKPDPLFVRELRLIDPELRVVWAQERYIKNAWAVERRLSPEEYYTKYGSLVEADGKRIVPQPIFDANDFERDPETGEPISYKQIGVREYDLAPEWEWLCFFDTLDGCALTEIRRSYAWNRNHPISRAKFEKEQAEAQERSDAAQKAKRVDAAFDGLDEALLDTRKRVQFGYGETRNEN